MTADTTVSRSLHDLGLATWFGGSLMGAVGLNGAAAQVQEPKQRLRVANAGWNRWTPVNLAGIAAHLAGGAVLLGANKGRVASQQGTATAAASSPNRPPAPTRPQYPRHSSNPASSNPATSPPPPAADPIGLATQPSRHRDDRITDTQQLAVESAYRQRPLPAAAAGSDRVYALASEPA
jgi:hypothetical protein